MKKLKKVRVLLLAITLLAVSLVGCAKKNEPVADLNNWINTIYVADVYTDEVSTTFTEEEFKQGKQMVKDQLEKDFLGEDVEAMKVQLASIGVENADQEAEDLMNELKDGALAPMSQSFKNIEFTVEEVSKDEEKATLKVISAPINLEVTMEKIMTLFAEKAPTDIDPASITPENAIDTLEKMLLIPMISAYEEGFAAPIYLEKQEVLIDMEYNTETKIWELSEESMEKLETIFLV